MIYASSRFQAFRRASLVYTLSGVLLFGGLLALYGRQYGWFQRSLTVLLVLPTSQGVRIGTPVQLSGLPVGVLAEQTLLPDGRVQLELRIPDRYRAWISPRSKATIVRDGLLGEVVVELSPAPMPVAAVPVRFSVATTEASPGLNTLLSGLEATRLDLQKLLLASTRVSERDVPAALAQLRSSLAAGGAAATTIQRELPPTAARVRSTLATADRTAAAAEQTANQARLTLRELSPELRQSVQEFSSLIRRVNGILKQLDGVLGPVDQPPSGPSAPP